MPETVITIYLNFIAILPGLYLRYLPFSHLLEQKQKNRLFLAYFVCWLCSFSLALYLSLQPGIFSISFMKALNSLAWLPLFLINLVCIRGYFFQQIFVLGMQFVYTITMHTVTSNIFLYVFAPEGYFHLLSQYLVVFTSLSLLFIPVVRPFFKKLFTVHFVGASHYYWRLICFVPLCLTLNDIFYINFAGNAFISKARLLPRALDLAACILLGAAIYAAIRHIEQYIALQQQYNAIRLQQSSILAYAQSLEKSQARLAIIRHDRRHYLNLLGTCLENGNLDEAQSVIQRIYHKIDETKSVRYCQNTLINAVLSRFAEKTDKANIERVIEVAAPAHISMEMDFAIVLSSLLENAINACETLPADTRSISVTLKDTGTALTLQIRNPFAGEIHFDDDGLPTTTEKEAGLGMQSLREFCQRTDSTVLYQQEDGWFTTYLQCPYTVVK